MPAKKVSCQIIRKCLRCGVSEKDSKSPYSVTTYFAGRRYCLKCMFILRERESKFWNDLAAIKRDTRDDAPSIIFSLQLATVEYGGDKPAILK